MRILKSTLLVLMLFGVLLNPSVVFGYSTNKDNTIVTNLILDDDDDYYYEIEIIPEQNDRILLPVKQIANILKIEYKVNNSTKEITFKTSIGSVRVTKEDVFLNGVKINTTRNGYNQLGIMSSTRDEIYTTQDVLNKIFKSEIQKLSIDKSDLVVNVKTKLGGRYIVGGKETGDAAEETKHFRAYSEVLMPNPKKKVSFNTLEFNNSMNSDSIKQMYLETSSGSSIFNNSTQFALKGEAYNGDLLVDFNTNNYTEKIFSFNGLGFRYKNSINGWDYELGKVSGFKDNFYAIGTDILGVQLYNYEIKPKKQTYRDIEGKVALDSVVNVYFDDEYHSTLDTYGGNYYLNDVYLATEPFKVRIEELKADNTKQDVFEKSFISEDSKKAQENWEKYSMFAGISGLNGRLFAQNGQLYQVNTKKFVAGIEKQYEINEYSKNTSRIVFDKISVKGEDTIWGQNYYNANSILSSGTFQNPNVLDGYTAINSFDYILSDKFKISATAAGSKAMDTTTGNWNGGYSLQLAGEYKEKNYNLIGGAYQFSPKFYLAGSDWGSYSDRAGVLLGGNYKAKYLSASTNYTKYFSNFDNIQGAGITGFDDISANVTGTIPVINTSLRANAKAKKGENLVGINQNYYYDVGLTKTFKSNILKNITLEAGQNENNYETQFFDSNQRDFTSKYTTLYLRTNVKMPRNKGQLSFMHDAVNYESGNAKNDYKIMKFGYSFPEFKRVRLYTEFGYKYAGQDTGNTFALGLGYRTKSDSMVTLNYQYGKDNGYLIDNMFIPSNMRHSINLSFNDTLAFVPRGLRPVGYSYDSRGFVEITTYYDKNKNGKFDKGDIPVPNVPIKVSWQNEPLYSGPQGMCQVAQLDKGVYKVEVDAQNMKTNISASKTGKDSQLIVISPQRTTQVAFPITSTVGTVSGKLSIVDDFDREKSVAEHIVVMIDENDTEVAYTTVDRNGDYIISGIEPGNYTVKLDESFINDESLSWAGSSKEKKKEDSLEGIKVEVPFSFRKFIDVNNANLIYKSW